MDSGTRIIGRKPGRCGQTSVDARRDPRGGSGMTGTIGRARSRLALVVGLIALTAPIGASGQSSTPSEPSAWRFVALGDSWPEGAHCGGCRTFVGRWADGLREAYGRDILLTDLTGQAEPGLLPGS